MSNGNNTQETEEEEETTSELSRRAAMLLAGAAGGSLLTAGSADRASASDGSLHVDGSNAMEADLDMGDGSNSINDIDNVRAASNYASFTSSGTGDGHLQFYDREAGSHMFRAFEGEPDKPGRIEFQSPIMGADESDVGTAPNGTRDLVIKETTVADRLRTKELPHADVTAYGAEGDGQTDDTTAIQDAINACPVDGTVWFPPGTYNITSQLNAQTDGITLRGPALIVADSGIDDPMLRVGGEGAVVEDLEFDGKNQARIGLWFEGDGKQTAQRCTARNISHDTSHIYGFGCATADVTFRDCRAIDITTTDDLNARGFQGGSSSARMTVDNCYVSNVDSADDADGIRLKERDSVVTGTHIEECGKRAIKVDGLSNHSRVEGNVCVWASGGPRRAGIQLQADECKTTNNHVEADGFESGAGILDITDGGGTIEGNSVVMRDASSGPWPDIHDGIEVSGDMTVLGNKIRVGGGRAGIRVQETATGLTIADNNITGAGAAGISLRADSGNSPTKVSISGGFISDVDYGVDIQDGTDIVINTVAFDTASSDINDPNNAATVGTNV